MPIDAKLPDGRVFRFPDGTSQEVIQATVRRELGVASGDDERRQRITELEQQQANLKEPSFLRDVVGQTVSDLRGIPETALQLATGAASEVPAGLAGIAGTVAGAVPGGESPSEKGARFVRGTQEALTFQPRTQPGQRVSQAVGEQAQRLDTAVTDLAAATGDEDDALGATLVKTAILGAPALFGLKFRPVTQARPTPKQQIARQAADEGYVTTPSTRGEGGVRGAAEGVGGTIKTTQQALENNQVVTNRLASRAVGLPDDVPVTVDTLRGIRAEAGRAYEAVRGVGQVITDTQFRRDIANATRQFKSAARDFPELAQTNVIREIDTLRKPSFDANSGIDMIRLLRNRADVAFRAGDNALGNAYRNASQAIESSIERHLTRSGSSVELVDNFRQAREHIAQTYSVQRALQGEAGNVSATNLASQLKRGTPLTGELRQIAEFAGTFPAVSRVLQRSPQRFSPLDAAVGAASAGLTAGGAAIGLGPAALLPLAVTTSRPLLRRIALSRPGQSVPPRVSVTGAGVSALSQIGQEERQ